MNLIAPMLSAASVAVGRLAGISDFVPNPDWFVYMYVRKEAVLSSQIEGTQTSLSGLLDFEAGHEDTVSDTARKDIDEVINYIRAQNGCIEGLREQDRVRGLGTGLLQAAHLELMQGVRGDNKSLGMLRKEQNWISRRGRTGGIRDIHDAAFVPPPHERVPDAMKNLESYLTLRTMPALVQVGIAHVQFETIHPFLDGNGRLGRLLIALLLAERGVMRRPLLYISSYLMQKRDEYYAWLTRVRETGDWEGWLNFFLEGVEQVAIEAYQIASELVSLQKKAREALRARHPGKRRVHDLLEMLFKHPVVTVKGVVRELGMDAARANSAVHDLCELGLLREITGQRRNRVFRYEEYLNVLTPNPT